MFPGRDLLSVGLMVAALVFAVRVVRAPAAVGRVGPAPPCEIPVEIVGHGVRCVGRAQAAAEGLEAGARLEGRGRGRMAPDRLAAWAAPVDVNRASVEELASLDGVGPKLAARIVAARPFRHVEEIANVRGIGRRRLARLRPRLSLDEEALDHVR